MLQSTIDRFKSKLIYLEGPAYSWCGEKLNGGCWVWKCGRGAGGYGAFKVTKHDVEFGNRARNIGAHRFSYTLYVGPIPDGLCLDHLCRNRLCVNPDHLEAVTMQINSLRGEGPVAENSKRKTCIRGHDYDLMQGPRKQWRRCRECERLSAVERRDEILKRRRERYASGEDGRRKKNREYYENKKQKQKSERPK